MATEHFQNWELACKDGCGTLPPREHQDRLERLRRIYGRPMILSSSARCPEYNDSVSSTGRDGPHTMGASDTVVYGRDARELIQSVAAMGLYDALRERGIEVPELLEPELVRRSVEMAWPRIGIEQANDQWHKRFVHLDEVETDKHSSPWLWTY